MLHVSQLACSRRHLAVRWHSVLVRHSGINEGHELALVREPCWPVLSWNHTYLACVAPKSGGNATVTVDVAWTEAVVPHSRVGFRTPAPAPKLATSAAGRKFGAGVSVAHLAVACLVALVATRHTGELV